MRTTTHFRPFAGFLFTAGLTLATAAMASAASIYVASHGTDSGSCGTKADPCRTIGKGIDQATVGGTVIVGPGRYGDLDEDGTLGEAGEETPGAVGLQDCMVPIDKQVTVVSSALMPATPMSLRLMRSGMTGVPPTSIFSFENIV